MREPKERGGGLKADYLVSEFLCGWEGGTGGRKPVFTLIVFIRASLQGN